MAANIGLRADTHPRRRPFLVQIWGRGLTLRYILAATAVRNRAIQVRVKAELMGAKRLQLAESRRSAWRWNFPTLLTADCPPASGQPK